MQNRHSNRFKDSFKKDAVRRPEPKFSQLSLIYKNKESRLLTKENPKAKFPF